MKFGVFLTTAQPPSLSEKEVLRRSIEYTQLAEQLRHEERVALGARREQVAELLVDLEQPIAVAILF